MPADHLNQTVVYGGLVMSRGDMIADLQRMAKLTGHPNPDALVARYMQGWEAMRP